MRTIAEAVAALELGRVSAVSLVETALARIADPAGEGARTFVAVHADAARHAAAAMDTLRHAGRAPSPYAGIPITVKDLFDEAGHVTRAGSLVLADAMPATSTATVVQRLQRLGFVVLGRTNMTEFAFSGLGINPHYGTPASPWDRATRRVPGGSSSGAGVAAAEGMGFGGLGSDTGGSCRIPAAMCGVVGYKPTQAAVPLAGVLPLSSSLDSIGPLAPSVACCAVLHGAIAGDEHPTPPAPRPLAGLRIGLPRGTFLTEDLDPAVARAFEDGLARLRQAGVRVEEFDLPELAEIPAASARGGFAQAESWAWHRDLVETRAAEYDPRVLKRIQAGAAIGAGDYITLLAARRRISAAITRRIAGFDAVAMPTCPLPPQPIAALEADEALYNRVNLLQLRNPTVANFIDGCAISLPCHQPGEAPAGLMLMAAHGADATLLALAAGVEEILPMQPGIAAI